jgi:hypothetical protein
MPLQLDAVVFCDDIREEAGSKITLVGVYGKNVYLPRDARFPAGIRQLCIYYRFENARGDERIRIRVTHRGMTIFESPEPAQLRAPKAPDDYSGISLYLIPFGVVGWGDYEFSLYLEGRDEPLSRRTLHFGPAPE